MRTFEKKDRLYATQDPTFKDLRLTRIRYSSATLTRHTSRIQNFALQTGQVHLEENHVSGAFSSCLEANLYQQDKTVSTADSNILLGLTLNTTVENNDNNGRVPLPFGHAFYAPHRMAETYPTIVRTSVFKTVVAQFDQFYIRGRLHASDALIQLLKTRV